MKNILVVGAGPAGMMAAIRACQLGQRVTLIEKNSSAGRKLLLSGKGRCNLTNSCDLDSFLERFSHGQFLRDAFKKFFNTELMRFFEERGLRLTVERQQRVFPADERSAAVLDVLLKELERCKARVLYKTALVELRVEGGKVTGASVSGGRFIEADAVVMATGGVSYAFTGSTGDGISISTRHGHTAVAPKPGLVPLLVKRDFEIPEGLTLKNIALSFCSGGKRFDTGVGEMIFTSLGISGPLVLTWSGKALDLLAKGPVSVLLDFKPGLTRDQVEARLVRDFAASPRVNIKNLLKDYLPQRMIAIFLSRAAIPADRKANQVSQQERRALVGLFKEFKMELSGSLSIEEAMVTRGGIPLKEIDPRTMESRRVKGLYFCGELIDVDADTGGFNLQAAFSTGYLAGESAAAPAAPTA